MRNPDRHQRVADAIKRVVAEAVHDEVKDFDLRMVTITRCDLARDFSEATIRYSVLGDDDVRRECAEKLAKVASFIQRRIADAIKIHHVPHVKFLFDPSLDDSMRLERLFNEIDRERRENG